MTMTIEFNLPFKACEKCGHFDPYLAEEGRVIGERHNRLIRGCKHEIFCRLGAFYGAKESE